MNRHDVVNAIETILDMDEDGYSNRRKLALRILTYIEDIGMLPPICTVTTKDGKHTPTERKWDDETE